MGSNLNTTPTINAPSMYAQSDRSMPHLAEYIMKNRQIEVITAVTKKDAPCNNVSIKYQIMKLLPFKNTSIYQRNYSYLRLCNQVL